MSQGFYDDEDPGDLIPEIPKGLTIQEWIDSLPKFAGFPRYCQECGVVSSQRVSLEDGLCLRCQRAAAEAQKEWENGGREAKRLRNLAMAEDFKVRAAEFRAKGDEPAARNWDRRVEECLRWACETSSSTSTER